MTTDHAAALAEARREYLLYILNTFGSDVAQERDDYIWSGREDDSEFIAGYLAAYHASKDQTDVA